MALSVPDARQPQAAAPQPQQGVPPSAAPIPPPAPGELPRAVDAGAPAVPPGTVTPVPPTPPGAPLPGAPPPVPPAPTHDVGEQPGAAGADALDQEPSTFRGGSESEPDLPGEPADRRKAGKKKGKNGHKANNGIVGGTVGTGGGSEGDPRNDGASSADAKSDDGDGRDKDAAKIKPRGYLQVQGSLFRDTNDDLVRETTSMFIRRARVGVRGRIVKDLNFEIEADVSEAQGIMKDAYVSIDFIPRHRLRVGQRKTPFGYENRTSSSRLLVLYRSEAGSALGRGPDLRDIGVFLDGDWRLPAGFRADYELALVNGAGANALVDDTPRKNVWGHAGVGWRSPARAIAVDLGVSYGNGDRVLDPTVTTALVVYKFTRYGADLQIETPFSFLAVEYLRGTDKRAVLDINHSGYYALLALRSPWNVGPLARYQVYDPDSDRGGPIVRRWTVGAYYDFLPIRARLLVNYEIDRSFPRLDDAVHAWAQIAF